MKRTTRPTLLILSLFFCLSLSSRAQKPELRQWTSASGAQVEATYERLDGTQLQLKKPDGKMLAIGLSGLSEADQKLAIELAKAAGHISDLGTGAVTEPKPEQLPTFADGKWKGSHTLYETPMYRLRIDAAGNSSIHLIEDNKDVGPALSNGFGSYYSNTSKPPNQRYTPRRIVRMLEFPKPEMIKGGNKTIVIKGELDDGVTFTRTYALGPSTIELSIDYDDPADLEYPTVVGYNIGVGRSLNPPSSMTFEEIKAETAGWELTLNGPNKSRETYPFWKSMNSVHGVDEAFLKGPWGKRTIEFDLPPAKKGKQKWYKAFGVYTGQPCYGGFHFGNTFAGEAESSFNLTIQ